MAPATCSPAAHPPGGTRRAGNSAGALCVGGAAFLCCARTPTPSRPCRRPTPGRAHTRIANPHPPGWLRADRVCPYRRSAGRRTARAAGSCKSKRSAAQGVFAKLGRRLRQSAPRRPGHGVGTRRRRRHALAAPAHAQAPHIAPKGRRRAQPVAPLPRRSPAPQRLFLRGQGWLLRLRLFRLTVCFILRSSGELAHFCRAAEVGACGWAAVWLVTPPSPLSAPSSPNQPLLLKSNTQHKLWPLDRPNLPHNEHISRRGRPGAR